MNVPTMMDSWNDPATRHAIIVHWPIVLSVLGAGCAVLSLPWPKSRLATMRRVRSAAIALLLIGVVAAFAASQSGDLAYDAAEGAAMSSVAHDLLHEHEEMGEKVWMLNLLTAVLLSVGLAANTWLRHGCGVLGAVAAVCSAMWVAGTAHLGGVLVYTHGVGVHRDQAASAAPPMVPVGGSTDARLAFFQARVMPTLQNSCTKCHNPSRAHRSGGLDLTSQETALKGGESGQVIVPGKPAESLLIKAIRHEAEDLEMPPKKPMLDSDIIAAFEQWIADGAAWVELPPSEETTDSATN